MEKINSLGFMQNWKLDKKGYFLIRIQKGFIEVGHCVNDNVPCKLVKGKNVEELIYKIIDLGLISDLEHAAYLGKEVQKAFVCLKLGKNYIQDEVFK